ncbi:hypothetical protein EFN13_24 [Enterococcus phage N13]|nr:hypothetical protein EFN13_24 [Enterococcus phage N13]
MKYTEKDIKVGTKLRCTKAKPSWWTVGKIYEVSLRNDSVLQIIDDHNHSATQDYIIDCLNGEHQPVKFELIKEENKMKYTENDLQLGDKLLCTKSEVDHWVSGKMYELKLDKLDMLAIEDEDGKEAYSRYLLECLNKEWDLVEFELIKEENNIQEFKIGDLVEVISNTSWAVNEAGEPYKKGDLAIITNVYSTTVRLGNNPYANLIKKTEVKKVETTPEPTDHEEELILRLAEAIYRKDNYIKEIEELKYKITELEAYHELVEKEVKIYSKKLLTK